MKILIQANNLDTVVDAFMYIYQHPGCTKEELADYYGFSLRQVDYYTNACKYLDLIDEGWGKTPLSVDIFENNPAEVTERVYARIISDEVIGKIFARIFALPNEDHLNYAIQLVKSYFPSYSETVYRRRADNMIKWSKKIINYLTKH